MGLLDIQPHQVSRDLRGYSVLFYGPPKVGKTSTAVKFPNSLLVAFEKGYSALPGVYAQPVNSWGDFLKVLRELKDSAVREKFSTIVIDTVDLAYEYAESYICNVEGVDAINKIPYGQGFTKVAKEFDSKMRQIVQLGYGLVLISHEQDKVFTTEAGEEYNKIVMTLPVKARLVTSRLCDIIGYMRNIEEDGQNKTYLFLRGTQRFEAGSRFKYIPERIELSYSNLVKAIGEAIDEEAKHSGEDFITDQRENLYLDNAVNGPDFDELMMDFGQTVSALIEKNEAHYAPRITEIVDRHLGKGKKVSACTRDQVMLVDIILSEIKSLA